VTTPTDTRTISVMIVDDADAIRKLIALILELETGIATVGEAADGVSAVELAGQLTPDVVLLDISMPRMDGIEALPLILERSPATKVVMVSGFGTDDIRGRCAELGAAAFIDKGEIAGSIARVVREAVH